MRKIIAVLISLIFLTVLAPTSLSDTEDINVTLTPSGNISINVDQPTWEPSVGIGGSLATDTDWANLDNDGNVQVDVTVEATDTTAWTLATSPAHNQFQMQWGTGTPGGEGNLELTPNGVSSSQGWVASSGTLDEAVASDDSEYIYFEKEEGPGGSSAEVNFNIPDHTTETGDIINVTIYGLMSVSEGFVLGETNFYAINTSDSQEGLPAASVGEISNVEPQYFSLAGQYRGMEDVPPYDYYYRDWTWTDIDNIDIGMFLGGFPFEAGTVYCDHFFARVYYETPAGVTWMDMALTPTSFVSNLSYDASQDFGLQVFMPTSTSSSANQTSTITFTATAD